MDHPLLDDAFIAAEIARAVAPLEGRIPDEELAWLRASLAELLQRDPSAAKALLAAYPRQVDDSGEQLRPPIREASEEDVERRGSGSA